MDGELKRLQPYALFVSPLTESEQKEILRGSCKEKFGESAAVIMSGLEPWQDVIFAAMSAARHR